MMKINRGNLVDFFEGRTPKEIEKSVLGNLTEDQKERLMGWVKQPGIILSWNEVIDSLNGLIKQFEKEWEEEKGEQNDKD